MVFSLWFRNVARAIEREHAMRTDGKIEYLRSLPTASPLPLQKGPRHVPLAALR
jgi:hypothetical protein